MYPDNNWYSHRKVLADYCEVKDKAIIKTYEVKKSIKIAEKLMKGYGRILVRKSGTESKIRVMVESENKELINKCINIISKKIK